MKWLNEAYNVRKVSSYGDESEFGEVNTDSSMPVQYWVLEGLTCPRIPELHTELPSNQD